MNQISIKRVEPILVASMRDKFNKNLFDQKLEVLWNDVNDYIIRNNGKRSFPCLMLFHNQTWTFEDDLDIEVCEPILKKLPQAKGVMVYELPAVEKMACIIHKGPFETMTKSYITIQTWIKENNYKVNGPVREIYHKGDWSTSNPQEYISELQFPIA